MSLANSESDVGPEEDEEGEMYQFIYDMKIGDDREDKEEAPTPASSSSSAVTSSVGRAHVVGLWVNGANEPNGANKSNKGNKSNRAK
ncbi:hypothetical protein EYF80_060888 [Liparis tanakae]|uniref:Uncharacterized protein n=1 Tax=Liparis tanakae TaxID=230148 RepID=A0A4Z2EJN6_9TELE|nr:hypothetical protein EYF80_060888 [Liparis tanakae]